MIPTVVHEFCHSYSNAFIDRHEAQLKAAGDKLYASAASAMRSQAYGGGKTVLYESLVRACVVRHTHKHSGEEAAKREIREQAARKFGCVERLSGALAEYESNRDRYATLEAFAPRLIEVFAECADEAAKEEALRPKVISIVPADGDRNVDPDLKAILVVFDRPMRDKSWSLVGGGPHFPETAGQSGYDSKCTTWTCPIRLKPNWDYRFRLNAGRFTAFRSREGVPLEPVVVSFKTGKKKAPNAAPPRGSGIGGRRYFSPRVAPIALLSVWPSGTRGDAWIPEVGVDTAITLAYRPPFTVGETGLMTGRAMCSRCDDKFGPWAREVRTCATRGTT